MLSVISVSDNTFLLFVFGPYLISAWISFPLAFWLGFNQAVIKNVDSLINFTSLYGHLFCLFCNLALLVVVCISHLFEHICVVTMQN